MIKKSMLFLFGAFVLLAASCSEDSKKVTGVEDNSTYSISGTISNPDNYSIPETAQLVVIWPVFTGSPDYQYIYGKGDIDVTKGTFKLSFDANPPFEALNRIVQDPNALDIGIGIIMVIESDTEIPEGFIKELSGNVLGAVSDRGIAFRQGVYSESISWVEDLHQGFSFVKGDYPDTGFDRWIISNTDGIELLIDERGKFKFPNWY